MIDTFGHGIRRQHNGHRIGATQPEHKKHHGQNQKHGENSDQYAF
jgi:hypothetical protein